MKYSSLLLVLALVPLACRNTPRRSAADYAAQRRQATQSPAAEGIEGFFAHPDEVLVRIHGRALTRGDFLEAVFRQYLMANMKQLRLLV